MLSSQGQGTSLKRRGLLASVKVHDTNNGKLLSPNHLRSLAAAPHSDLSARQYEEVFPGYDVRTSAWQHVFRGCLRSYSATASLRHREGKLCGSCGRKTHPETDIFFYFCNFWHDSHALQNSIHSPCIFGQNTFRLLLK